MMEHLYNLTFAQYLGIFVMVYAAGRIFFDVKLFYRNKRNYKKEIKDLEFEHCPVPTLRKTDKMDVFPIQYVSEGLIYEVIDKRQIKGRFYTDYHNDCSGEVQWLACDNSTGEAWTEDFDTKVMCLSWLDRKLVYGAGKNPVGYIAEENECEHPFYQCIIEEDDTGIEITCSICGEVILSDMPNEKSTNVLVLKSEYNFHEIGKCGVTNDSMSCTKEYAIIKAKKELCEKVMQHIKVDYGEKPYPRPSVVVVEINIVKPK